MLQNFPSHAVLLCLQFDSVGFTLENVTRTIKTDTTAKRILKVSFQTATTTPSLFTMVSIKAVECAVRRLEYTDFDSE